MPKVKTVSSKRFFNCPNTILTVDHYEDGDDRCRCFRKDAPEMAERGYRWDERKGRWS